MSASHEQSIEEVLREQQVQIAHGLSSDEAQRRRAKHGPNELIEAGLKSPWKILLEQLTSTLVLVLIAAAIVSGVLGDWHDAVAILAIVVLNALLGFRQEYKAERAMAALKKLAVPQVRVRRDGHIIDLKAPELTVGDIVLLEAGSAIPADGRLLESASLRVQEAALTGESQPVEKDAHATLAADTPLADRRNMAFAGTAATYGRGVMLVTEIGMQTQLGHIAKLIQTAGGDTTPLQKRLDHLGRWLALVALVLVGLVFVIGWWRGEAHDAAGFRNLLLTSVSLAVAAVPEGLAAVVTIALALGAQRMLARRALIRKLPAVETLGSVTTICSDKTGTLTKNQMTVTAFDVAGRHVEVTEATDPDGQLHYILNADAVIEMSQHPSLALLLAGGELCNDAVVEHNPTPEDAHGEVVVGDPTEGALVLAGHRLGVDKEALEAELPRIDEMPFDSERKRMSTLHRSGDDIASEGLTALLPTTMWEDAEYVVFAKGALDSLLKVSKDVWIENRREPLDDARREKINASHNRLAEQGMRVLGIAFRTLATAPTAAEQKGHVDWEKDLTFVGLVGLLDPPRPEALDAIAECHTAGIRVMMITGDHPLTAQSIATKLGIDAAGGVVTGQELDQYSDEQLEIAVRERSIYARVSPEHKLRLVEALRKQGQIVAMTGDGVNDAPALKQADIGVAMGITGTDVSKEASDMVLLDDNFATIVHAVEEGRVIFDNVRKFIRYLLCTNAGEIWVMMIGPLMGMPLPLLPLQILWMNLATDGFPALALGVEPAERNIMRRPPRDANASIFAGGVGIDVIWIGLLMAALALGIGYWSWSNDPSGPWQTLVFTTMTLSQLAHALAVRSEHDNFWQLNWLSNKSLLVAVSSMFALQMLITYVPMLQGIFRTEALTAGQLATCIGLASLVFVGVEIEKWFGKLWTAKSA